VIFLCVNYLARSANAQVSKREKPFFSPKTTQKFFFLCKTPYLSTKPPFFFEKKLDQAVFSISEGPPALFVHQAGRLLSEITAIAILWDVWTLKNQDLSRINGIFLR